MRVHYSYYHKLFVLSYVMFPFAQSTAFFWKKKSVGEKEEKEEEELTDKDGI